MARHTTPSIRLTSQAFPTTPRSASEQRWSGDSDTKKEVGERMTDLIFITTTVLFFLLALAYVRACDKL
jgi:hypothetical protein